VRFCGFKNSGLARTGNCRNFDRYLFATFGLEANIIKQRHEVLYQLLWTLKCLTLNYFEMLF